MRTEHADSLTEGILFTWTDSWFMGTNVPDEKRTFLLYAGGAPAFRDIIAAVAASDYRGFDLRCGVRLRAVQAQG